MLKQCFEKCVEHFHESELSLGENTCLDRQAPYCRTEVTIAVLSALTRISTAYFGTFNLMCGGCGSVIRCVGKYMESQQKVGETMAKVSLPVRSFAYSWTLILVWQQVTAQMSQI